MNQFANKNIMHNAHELIVKAFVTQGPGYENWRGLSVYLITTTGGLINHYRKIISAMVCGKELIGNKVHLQFSNF